jgi:prepilin-type N-terminal cleavage/methylation domain-containing protein
MKNKKGFTLIELLVVVLIIGILAAIALPQYQKALAKTKASSLFQQAKSIRQAVNLYYLTTGKDPANFQELDGPFTSCPTATKCCFGNDCYDWLSDYVRIYKPLPGIPAWQCDVRIRYNLSNSSFCYVYTKKGAQVAESLGFTPHETNCTDSPSVQCSYFFPQAVRQ